jgi:hypothetical protein
MDNPDVAKTYMSRLWEARELYALDAVFFKDGQVALLEVDYPGWAWKRDSHQSLLTVLRWTAVHLLSTQGKRELFVSSLLPLCSLDVIVDDVELRFQAGECGGDGQWGFVSAIEMPDDAMLWSAFFTKTDSFFNIELSQQQLVATSTSGCEARFPPTRPLEGSLIWPKK